MMEARTMNILNQLLKDMSGVLNVTPGAAYTSKDAETLLVMHRRMSPSELQSQLGIYNEIFTKQKGASIKDITNSAVAYIKIKVLLTAGADNYDARSLRELIKEFNSQIARTTNIIRLSKANALTADAYQKEVIELTIEKNEAFIKAYTVEVTEIERRIARMPVVIEESASSESKDEEVKQIPVAKPSLFAEVSEKVSKVLSAKKERMAVEERLRDEEKKRADTMCEEIPFYDSVLVFTEHIAF